VIHIDWSVELLSFLMVPEKLSPIIFPLGPSGPICGLHEAMGALDSYRGHIGHDPCHHVSSRSPSPRLPFLFHPQL
jgi:hypothetical protein